MSVPDEVVVDSNRRSLVVSLVNTDGTPIDLGVGGSVAVKLQGTSDDLATPSIDYAGTVTDHAQGILTFTSVGLLVTATQLGSLKKATYNLRVKYTDSTAKFDYTPIFQIDWVHKPV